MASAGAGMADTQVLIVGAGPTGLALAMWLTRMGVRIRIVDRSDGPGTTSRAIGIQARTLELHDQLGLSEEIVRNGYRLAAANLWVEGRRLSRAPFDDLGPGLGPYPIFPYLIFAQDEYEQLLVARLEEAGVRVERNTELLELFDDGSGVSARLSGGETCRADYLAGCDGARSRVRQSLGIDFPGSTYPHIFFVADVQARGPACNGELHMALNDTDFFAVFPRDAHGRVRLIGTVNRTGDALEWEEAHRSLSRRLEIEVEQLCWFSTYRVHNRIAARFRQGRCFLLGDAAHVHSPVGAQGMNTGIGDAVNLDWKLAAALRRGDDGPLSTYSVERQAFARRLVSTTDQAFRMVTSNSWLARWLRCRVAPGAVPLVVGFRPVRRLIFRYISQTAIHYRRSPLSVGRCGRIQAGDRAPWRTAPEWSIRVQGPAAPALRALCEARGLALYEGSTPSRGTLYLVRPDGYVALVAAVSDIAAVADYQDRMPI